MTDKPDILELMARAIAAEEFDDSVKEFGAEDARERSEYIEDHWPACVRKARAALTAALDHMREPSGEMGMAGYAAWDTFGEDAVMGPHELIAIWRAMLSQLRKEALDDD